MFASCARWMADELEPSAARLVDALPFTRVAESAPGLHVVHGSPRSYREGIGPWTDDDKLSEIMDEVEPERSMGVRAHPSTARTPQRRPIGRQHRLGRAVIRR